MTQPCSPSNEVAVASEGFARPLSATIASIFILTAIAAMRQFASNVYIPSLPAVAASVDASPASAQLTYAVFLASFAVGQLFYGPLADRFG